MMARVRLRLATFAVISVTGFSLAQYVLNARARANAHECLVVTSQSGQYRAESCVTGTDGNVVSYVGRLYDAHRGILLARTDFDSMDGGLPEFMPGESAVIFRRGEGNGSGIGFTDIPPGWLDRLRAKIP